MSKAPPDSSAATQRFSGFADHYDRYRPPPPDAFAALLSQFIGSERPALVVDLGSGTGLSSRYWADKAQAVIGVEPSADMRREALARTTAPNVSYVEGGSHHTGLPADCAQLVTCMQALHWMEPQSTFEEAGRILRIGGAFAAIDYDWPPVTTDWEVDAAWAACLKRAEQLDRRLRRKRPLMRWDKHEHLERMHHSNCFRYTRDLVTHHRDEGNAERYVGLLLSQGSVRDLLKAGRSEDDLGITALRELAHLRLGDALRTWHWSARVRIGVV